MAAKKPIIALMYDFDKTLCTTDMQAYTFIPNLGMSADAFWKKASDLAENKKMDRILAYMYLRKSLKVLLFSKSLTMCLPASSSTMKTAWPAGRKMW